MNHKEFTDVVTKELDYVRELLCSKSKEYDFGEDRFHSFKAGGQLRRNKFENIQSKYY